MEEIKWNFISPSQLKVNLVQTGRELILGGELKGNHTFLCRSVGVDNCPSLTRAEKNELKDLLSCRTRNDKLRILFE